MNQKEEKRLKIEGQQIEPVNKEGLEDYCFVRNLGCIFVYHYVNFELHGRIRKNWLSCSSGWIPTPDGKYRTAADGIGFKHHVVDTIEDIFDYYREGKINENRNTERNRKGTGKRTGKCAEKSCDSTRTF